MASTPVHVRRIKKQRVLSLQIPKKRDPESEKRYPCPFYREGDHFAIVGTRFLSSEVGLSRSPPFQTTLWVPTSLLGRLQNKMNVFWLLLYLFAHAMISKIFYFLFFFNEEIITQKVKHWIVHRCINVLASSQCGSA